LLYLEIKLRIHGIHAHSYAVMHHACQSYQMKINCMENQIVAI